MLDVTPSDMCRMRSVSNDLRRLSEHLEAMQRDIHGLEYAPWKEEVDYLWRGVFARINVMNEMPQKHSLEEIRELWTTYITHYDVVAR